MSAAATERHVALSGGSVETSGAPLVLQATFPYGLVSPPRGVLRICSGHAD